VDIQNKITKKILNIPPVQRQSLISFSTLIAITGIGYFSTMYFAHVLGPAILGSYFLFLAYYGIFDLIGDGGFGGAAVKRISEGKDQEEFFTVFVFLRIILIVLSVSVVLLIAPFLVDLNASGLVSWLILALVVGTVFSISYNGLYASAKAGVAQTSNFLNTVIRITVQVVATYLGYSAIGLAGGFIVGMGAGILINLRYLHLGLARFNLDHVKSLFSFSFWIFLASSGAMVFAYADTIFIGYFMSNADVGIYRVALQLASAATFITVSLRFVLYPRMSHWHSTGELASLEGALSRAFTYSLVLAVPAVIGGYILGDNLLYYLYGSTFESGTPALLILFLVQVVNIFMYLQTMALNATDNPKKSFIVTAVSASLNIGLNIAFIPLFGIVGAAMATLISMLLNAVLAYHYLSSVIRVKIEAPSVLNILKAAGLMGACVLVFRFLIPIESVWFLVGAVGLGTIVYSLLILKFDASINDEIRNIVQTLGLPWPGFL